MVSGTQQPGQKTFLSPDAASHRGASQTERFPDLFIVTRSPEFHDLEHTQFLTLPECFTRLFDDLVGQILVGVMTLCIDRGIKPLLSQFDRFIDAVERAVRIRSERWIVVFRHGVYP